MHHFSFGGVLQRRLHERDTCSYVDSLPDTGPLLLPPQALNHYALQRSFSWLLSIFYWRRELICLIYPFAANGDNDNTTRAATANRRACNGLKRHPTCIDRDVRVLQGDSMVTTNRTTHFFSLDSSAIEKHTKELGGQLGREER